MPIFLISAIPYFVSPSGESCGFASHDYRLSRSGYFSFLSYNLDGLPI
jgi:hypothetical protein